MLQTLFTIPRELGGVSLAVWVFGLWALVSAISVWRLAAAHGWQQTISESWFTLLLTGGAVWLLPGLMEPEGLPIRGYGVMLVLAVASGVGLSAWRAKRIGFNPELILSLAMWLFVSGILGARLFYVIEYWPTFQRESWGDMFRAVLSVTRGGLVVYGSLLAGGAALVVFVYKHKLPGLVLSDLIAPGVVLGMAIGRVGCFLNGCCYGGACDLPWAVTFPQNSPPYVDQMLSGELTLYGMRFEEPYAGPAVLAHVDENSAAARNGMRVGDKITEINGKEVDSGQEASFRLLEVSSTGKAVEIKTAGDSTIRTWLPEALPARSKPIHPAQLYSAIDATLLCLFLLAYDPFRKREGVLTALTLTIHPISRFLLEIIRIDESAVFGTSMSISQNISLGVLAGAVVCWIVVLSRPKGLWRNGAIQPISGS